MINILEALVTIDGELEIIEDNPYLIVILLFMYNFDEVIDLL